MKMLSFNGAANLVVMRGLDPCIHLLLKSPFSRWIAGSSPAMTNCKSGETA